MSTSGIKWATDCETEACWRQCAEKFMLDPDEIYLNTGSWGSLPKSAFEVLIQGLKDLEGNPTRNRKILTDRLHTARKALGHFLQAPAEDLALVPNVTVAINMVIHGLTWQPGDEILASDQEYGAIDNCLHHAHKRWGITLKEATIPIPPRSPEDIVEAFRACITENTRLLVCSHIATRTGLITPIEQLAQLAHEHGARIVIDGAHAPGMIPLNLAASGCDFYGGNCHKWLCAPKGTGFLYTRPESQEDLQHLIVSWGYNKNGASRNEKGMLQINRQPYMWQLEHWGTRDMACFGAIGEAVALQEAIGKDRIYKRGQQLAAYLRKHLMDKGWAELLSPTHPEMTGSISTFKYPNMDFAPISTELYNKYRITTPLFKEPDGVVQRVSTHIYNSFEQIDLLLEALETFRP